jgi:hypothetical protein
MLPRKKQIFHLGLPYIEINTMIESSHVITAVLTATKPALRGREA